jgi:hypothetical protein
VLKWGRGIAKSSDFRKHQITEVRGDDMGKEGSTIARENCNAQTWQRKASANQMIATDRALITAIREANFDEITITLCFEVWQEKQE